MVWNKSAELIDFFKVSIISVWVNFEKLKSKELLLNNCAYSGNWSLEKIFSGWKLPRFPSQTDESGSVTVMTTVPLVPWLTTLYRWWSFSTSITKSWRAECPTWGSFRKQKEDKWLVLGPCNSLNANENRNIFDTIISKIPLGLQKCAPFMAPIKFSLNTGKHCEFYCIFAAIAPYSGQDNG